MAARRVSGMALAAALLGALISVPGTTALAAPLAAPVEIVATTASAGYVETGDWNAARDPGYQGGISRFSRTEGSTASWTVDATVAGNYAIDVYHAGSVDNAKATYAWTGGPAGGTVVDQTSNGNRWREIGVVQLDAGESLTLTVTAPAGPAVSAPELNVITRSDAIRLRSGILLCGTVDGAVQPAVPATRSFDSFTVTETATTVSVSTPAWSMDIDRAGFRYSLASPTGTVAAAHPESGLQLGHEESDACDAVSATLTGATEAGVEFSVLYSNGRTAEVTVVPSATSVQLAVQPDDAGSGVIRARVAGNLNPAFGLGDLGGFRTNLNAYGVKNLDYYAQNSDGTTNQRFVSNFTVFPDRGLAQVAFDRGRLAVQVDDDATMLGVRGTSMTDLHYFFGDMPTIYGEYAQVRNEAGFIDLKPDHQFFGVGYESYGALGYNTNQATITQSLTDYLAKGYPIEWAVTGSGFWPYGPNSGQGTTSSFGMWGEKYPTPDAYKQFFADNEIALILGARQSFPALPEHGGKYNAALDGPWSVEGLEKGYFLTDPDGQPKVVSPISFPTGKIYLLDPDNPEAIDWFVGLEAEWGAQGFKEDHMFNATSNTLYDNALVNAVNEALHNDGNLMMVRNSAYSVGGSILRINDTDYNHGGSDRDRTVVNSLAYAASGQPNFYPDIVGGRIITDLETNVAKQKFLARNAMMAAMSPSMSFGNEPWRMNDPVLRDATLKAALWHDEYQPYIYSAAVESFETGYPSTATPLPIAYPNDPATYNLVSHAAKQYEWMMGPSLLVAPLYGSDTGAAMARDVYLPEGDWLDIESGERFTGPTTLAAYPQPFGKIPAFVGGTGILVRDSVDDGLAAQVFPVAATGSTYRFTDADGSTRSTIAAHNTGWDADSLQVRRVDGAGQPDGAAIPFIVDAVTGAVEFAITAGADYAVVDRAADPDPGTPPTTVVTPIDEEDFDPALELTDATASSSQDGDTRTLRVDLGSGFADKWVYLVVHSTPTPLGWFLANGQGVVTAALPSSIAGGTHSVAVYDATGAFVGYISGVQIAALIPADVSTRPGLSVTGSESAPLVAVGLSLLLSGALALYVARRARLRRRASDHRVIIES